MSKWKNKTACSLVLCLTLLLVATAVSAQAEIVEVTVTANVTPPYPWCTLFGQTETSPGTVSFRLDTSEAMVIPAGTLLGPGENDYYGTDLYSYQISALSAVSASYGNKTWNADDVYVGPFGGWEPNPSAAVWFDGPVTAGGNALPTILFEDSAGRLQTAPVACGLPCFFMNRMEIQDTYAMCGAMGEPLAVEVVPTGMVVIDGCNTGVPDTLLPSGSRISDRITECAWGARTHGQFTRCVSGLTDGLKANGVITGPQRVAIQRCAAQADIP